MINRINRVVLIGTGAVGCSYAYSMVNQGVAEELILIDVNHAKAEGEAMDLMHGIAFAPSTTKVRAGTYSDCAKADLIVITAGLPQMPGETRLDLVDKNVKIFKVIMKQIMDTGFNGLFLIASNPVDVLTYLVWKESGLPSSQVIGSGTTLDSARFRVMLGDYLGVDAHNVHTSIIGEHGDSEFPAWSKASIGIESLEEVLARRDNPNDEEELEKIFHNVRDAAYHIIERKGATYYGIGMCLTRITKAILNNQNAILPVSCLMEGHYGQSDLYIGTPAIINRAGIKEVIELSLNEKEMDQFQKSAEILKEMIKNAQI